MDNKVELLQLKEQWRLSLAMLKDRSFAQLIYVCNYLAPVPPVGMRAVAKNSFAKYVLQINISAARSCYTFV